MPQLLLVQFLRERMVALFVFGENVNEFWKRGSLCLWEPPGVIIYRCTSVRNDILYMTGAALVINAPKLRASALRRLHLNLKLCFWRKCDSHQAKWVGNVFWDSVILQLIPFVLIGLTSDKHSNLYLCKIIVISGFVQLLLSHCSVLMIHYDDPILALLQRTPILLISWDLSCQRVSSCTWIAQVHEAYVPLKRLADALYCCIF